MLRATRHHWRIENSLYWVLDVALAEDHSRVRTGHSGQNLAILRRLALNLLKQEESAKVGIKAKRKKAGWDYDYLLRASHIKMRLPCRARRQRSNLGGFWLG